MEKYAVIMGGGSGKRLWPLSTAEKPKQFLDLFGSGTLLENTLRRLCGLFERDHIFVVGAEAHRDLLYQSTEGLLDPSQLLLEPTGRNTAPCIALAALHILSKEEDALLCILPADHYVEGPTDFQAALTCGLDAAEKSEGIVTIGIEPTFPSTGYGYIHLGDPFPGTKDVLKVRRFVEKPDLSTACAYVESGEYLWNGGIFISGAKKLLGEFSRHLPHVYREVSLAYGKMRDGEGNAGEIYARIPSISFDHGIMEKCDNILVVPGRFEWSDAGSFQAIREILKDSSGNAVISGELTAPETENLLVYSHKKVVVAPGIHNLVVMDTGDVLYICTTEQSENSK